MNKKWVAPFFQRVANPFKIVTHTPRNRKHRAVTKEVGQKTEGEENRTKLENTRQEFCPENSGSNLRTWRCKFLIWMVCAGARSEF
jgi:hypothetical protein